MFKLKKRDDDEAKVAKKKELQEKKERKKREKEEKLRVKKAVQEAKKARLEDLKKDKEELYVLRKNTFFKVLRFLIWSMLCFFFIKGVIVSIRPDPTAKVNSIINDFKANLNTYQNQNQEILGFAQNFVTEYMTYKAGEEFEYVERLKPYVTDTIINAAYRFPQGSKAKVLYAGAYKQTQYSPTQYDVWVMTTVSYISKTISEDGIASETETEDTVVLKVPVSVDKNKYIVEDYPAFVSDDQKAFYEKQLYTGKESTAEIKNAVELALSNFFKAYYESDQSVIDYYLSPDADPSKFIGLQGRISLEKIEELRVYYSNENSTTDFLALVTLSVKDKNNAVITQHYHLKIIYKDKQYYVVDMDVRNTNLK